MDNNPKLQDLEKRIKRYVNRGLAVFLIAGSIVFAHNLENLVKITPTAPILNKCWGCCKTSFGGKNE